MDQRDTIQLLIGGICGLLTWFLKELWSDHKKLKEDVSQLEKRIPVEYASKDDVHDTEHRINSRIDRSEANLMAGLKETGTSIQNSVGKIWAKLDNKVDKK